ncbi:MAG: acyltransferase family protein [Aquabacterium sp.]
MLRTDIQVLRAIAVLSVLVFHFDLPGLDKGYLGVDIFFVISGYLMSGLIMKEMDEGRFSAAHFYLRRARRLLPAALAVCAAVTAIAPLVLTPGLLHDYALQLIGAVSFSANIVLWQQSGYFDGTAALKPLLHTWSLSLEEQYYVLLPLVLMATRPRWRLPVLLGLTLASAAFCLWLLRGDPSGAFYLLPTRAWELLIGSVCALPGLHERLHERLHALTRRIAIPTSVRWDAAWLCLPVMAWCLIKGVDARHPRGDALLVCLATAGLLVMPSKALQSGRPWMRPLRWIGDQSYSLYLVHWPLIALAKSVWLEGVPMGVSLGLLLVSVVIAQVSYTQIEQRFRHIDAPRPLAMRMLWLLIPLAIASGWLWHRLHPEHAPTDWAQALRPNYGFSPNCDQETDFKAKPACTNARRPRTMIWGDSYAMHLVPAFLASAPPGGIVQATRSACAPILSMARQVPTDPDDRAASCLAFNQSVLDYLAHAPHIEYVVLSARWPYFFEDPVVGAQGQPLRPTPDALAQALQDTIAALQRRHKKVVLVAPPASLGPKVNLGLCAERKALGLPVVMTSAHNDCSFARELYRQRQQATLGMLTALTHQADINVISLDDVTCDGGRCNAMAGPVAIYRDNGHLSIDGARLLGERLDLKRRLPELAR